MVRNIVFVLLAGGLVSFCAATASAGNAILGQEYGSGVHAFFTGDNIAAYERLTAAIKGGSKDPRAFYFRGLVYLKLGRGPEATMDFRRGAELESKDFNRFYNVGKSLERVQGKARIELERYRVEARMAALEEVERIRKARYEVIRREEARVLREQALAAPETPIKPAPTTPAEEENPFAVPEEENPFAVPEKKPAAQPDKKPAAKPPVEEDPFADEAEKKPAEPPAAEEKPAPDDPFADEPEEKKPTDDPEAKKRKGGLMGAIGGAIGKSLGGKKKPADGEGKKDDKPAEEKPAEKKPADEEKDQPDDPFAFAP